MLKKISNDHQAAFLYIGVLFCAYAVVLNFGKQLYCDVTSILLNVSIVLIMLYRLKTTKNLNSYWAWIVLGVIGWVIADVMWAIYNISHEDSSLEALFFIQVIYFIPFILFLAASVAIFIRSRVKLNANDRGRSAMDIFCFKDGKIVERRDII